MRKIFAFIFAVMMLAACGVDGAKLYRASDFGIVPNTGKDMTKAVAHAIETIKKECAGKPAQLLFEGGEYDFYPEDANVREYYISNHDQDNPKLVALALEGVKNLTITGKGLLENPARFLMNGRMLPIAMIDCENCKIEGVTVDTRVPQITQVEVIENDTEKGVITYRVAPYANYRIIDGRFVTYGSNWDMVPCAGIAFEGDSKRLVYRTSDIGVGVTDVVEIAPRVIRAPWNDNRLVPGTVIAMRSYYRPTPGIFVSNSNNTCFSNVTVHYAEGMGLLMQTCENVTLDNFNVSLREGDGRYFTTQADATHFSSCKGVITSKNGLYEGMMDDAINVHGTYLRVVDWLEDICMCRHMASIGVVPAMMFNLLSPM